MHISGKLVIGGILLLAVGAASLSLWHHNQQMRRAMAFWGTQQALLIAKAPDVMALKLESADDPAAIEAEDVLHFGDMPWRAIEIESAVGSKGLSNVRLALVQDVTYEWNADTAGCGANWQYALTFRKDDKTATVLFDFDGQCAALAESDHKVRLDHFASDEIKAFVQEQFK